MTYGVDECRVCGAKMVPKDPGPWIRYQKSLTYKRPPMEEAQWRALGLKACPTKHQLWDPTDGCCDSCKFIVGEGQARPWLYFGIVMLFAAIVLGTAIKVMFMLN